MMITFSIDLTTAFGCVQRMMDVSLQRLDVSFDVFHIDSLITSEMLTYFLLHTAQLSKIQWKILDSIVAVGIFE
jgi:hypothetical protein